jgi:Domain of unknown function (DUF4190)/HAAS
MNVHTDPLVDDYLRRMDAAASALPAHRRDELVSEIRDHLLEGLRRAPASGEAAVRNLLERLGPPEEIVAAATDSAPSGQIVAPFQQTNSYAIAAVLLGVFWFAGLGSVFALVFGYRARREIERSAGAQKGTGLAAAGIVLGWIGIALLALVVVAVLGLTAASSGGGSGAPLPAPSP